MIDLLKLPDIVDPPCWRLMPVDLSDFFRNLTMFAPTESTLCLEGVMADDIEEFLVNRPADYQNRSIKGWFGAENKIFYTPVVKKDLELLGDLSSHHAEIEVCGHLQIYSNNRLLLSRHDLPHDPIFVSLEITEQVVEAFCRVLGSEYSKIE